VTLTAGVNARNRRKFEWGGGRDDDDDDDGGGAGEEEGGFGRPTVETSDSFPLWFDASSKSRSSSSIHTEEFVVVGIGLCGASILVAPVSDALLSSWFNNAAVSRAPSHAEDALASSERRAAEEGGVRDDGRTMMGGRRFALEAMEELDGMRERDLIEAGVMTSAMDVANDERI